MSYRRMANTLANQGVTRMAGDIPVYAVYRSMPRNPAPTGSRLDFPPAVPMATTDVQALKTSAGAFAKGASGDARQTEEAYDQFRKVDAVQLTDANPATGDEWQEDGKIYRVDKLRSNGSFSMWFFALTYTRTA